MPASRGGSGSAADITPKLQLAEAQRLKGVDGTVGICGWPGFGLFSVNVDGLGAGVDGSDIDGVGTDIDGGDEIDGERKVGPTLGDGVVTDGLGLGSS